MGDAHIIHAVITAAEADLPKRPLVERLLAGFRGGRPAAARPPDDLATLAERLRADAGIDKRRRPPRAAPRFTLPPRCD